MLKKRILVLTGLCLMLAACGNSENGAAQISLSETVRGYEAMSYGEFREQTGKDAELYHADRFIGEIPDSSLCIIYTGKYDENLAGYTLSDGDVPIRMEGALGALLEGIDREMSVTDLTAALSKSGAEAVCELSEGAGTAYYVGDRYADIQFDSDRDGAYDRRLLISLDDAAEEEVGADSAAWLEMISEQAAEDSADITISRFWDEETADDEHTLKFITGLEVILPDSWIGKTVYDVETGPKNAPASTTLIVSEKTNAEADGSGVLCYLTFYLHEEGEEQYLFETDRVLGLYEQSGKQYVLVLELPREMMYVEGDAELRANYEALSAYTDLLQIKTGEMSDFTECGAEDLEWVVYL